MFLPSIYCGRAEYAQNTLRETQERRSKNKICRDEIAKVWTYDMIRSDIISNEQERKFSSNGKTRENRLRWFGDALKRIDSDKTIRSKIMVQRIQKRGRPKKRWINVIEERRGVDESTVRDKSGKEKNPRS